MPGLLPLVAMGLLVVDLAVEFFLLVLFSSAVHGARTSGPRPWTVGVLWLAGVPRTQVLAGDLGHVGGTVAGERIAVTVARCRLSTLRAPCRRR